MEMERIAACDENGKAIGVRSRDEIHRTGLWHETFHCWIVEMTDEAPLIHLQLRSSDKKDFPGLLDISAAGHILAHETVEDGVREIVEELGIEVGFDELIPLGIIKDRLTVQNFIDNERCHVFLYKTEEGLDNKYEFQKEEVAGMFKFDFLEFIELSSGHVAHIESRGEISAAGKLLRRQIGLSDLVPHEPAYLKEVVDRIQKALLIHR
ncbi:NUDIX hydrolase [Planococcus beigongshangi]|uniref:NUDIX hydrolase n=1 Tax=Planococcus beigongshangi TaxID=2782536 RepID=UPI00193BC88D|nr:NUDIX domain-containing protein [Planococcus beigongshangi]